MKLASRNNGKPDGELLVVSSDLQYAVTVTNVATCLREAVENWQETEPRLRGISEKLNRGAVADAFPFRAEQACAPLPRAFQWLDASAFHSHGERMVQAFNVVPESLKVSHPLMYQGCSDRFYGPLEDFPVPSELNIDLEAEVAVILDHVAMASSAKKVEDKVLLVMLANDVSLRSLIHEMNLGFGMLQCKPSTAFSPVAVTPDELGTAWRDGRLQREVHVEINGKAFGHPHAGEMRFSFYDLIAHAAATRELTAGTVLGSGTVSNYDQTVGAGCVSEQRAMEKLGGGEITTPFLRFGDTVRIETFDEDGSSIFGAIDHRMVQLKS